MAQRSLLRLLPLSVVMSLPAQLAAQETPADAPAITRHDEPVYLGLNLHAGAMATDDQRGALHLDRGGGDARITFGGNMLEWLSGEVTLGFLAVGSSAGDTGLLLDLSLALRAMPRFGAIAPYLAVSVGEGVTGRIFAPTFHAELGVLFDVLPEFALGPEIGLTHVAWEDGPNQSSDALFPSVGVSFRYRFQGTDPAQKPDVAPHVAPTPEPAIEAPEPSPDTFFAPAPPAPPVNNDVLFELVDRAVPATLARTTHELVSPLLFEHDTTELSSCGEASLYDVLAAIEHAPASAHIVIEGHADGTGDIDYNRALSLRRAEEVRRFLVAHQVDAARMEIRAVGEAAPLVDEADTRALSLNRRVRVLIETVAPITAEPVEVVPAPEAAPERAPEVEPSPYREGAP
jgi:outer membrane protein OmpA-like peptidoglycan-associated protein